MPRFPEPPLRPLDLFPSLPVTAASGPAPWDEYLVQPHDKERARMRLTFHRYAMEE
jgi:hypothetical protein